jgi:hypothetical protein
MQYTFFCNFPVLKSTDLPGPGSVVEHGAASHLEECECWLGPAESAEMIEYHSASSDVPPMAWAVSGLMGLRIGP